MPEAHHNWAKWSIEDESNGTSIHSDCKTQREKKYNKCSVK